MGRHASGERRSRLTEAGAVGAAGVAADVRLLVTKKRLLALSAAAVVVIFGAYFGVLTAVGHRGSWLLFLIVPAGLSGVAVGALLDRAHGETSVHGEAHGEAHEEASTPLVELVEIDPDGTAKAIGGSESGPASESAAAE